MYVRPRRRTYVLGCGYLNPPYGVNLPSLSISLPFSLLARVPAAMKNEEGFERLSHGNFEVPPRRRRSPRFVRDVLRKKRIIQGVRKQLCLFELELENIEVAFEL